MRKTLCDKKRIVYDPSLIESHELLIYCLN